ncbi:hypothetical protein H7J07_05385 [Mycobacterium koreense]|uniref:Uncharacterized protein n=1 Tax=Mycolicibacillus koreensis TaxID=1069220 RepID=A0A7I7SC18_9MYCO|nr:hypothetical protein [Mycolicibacillus koreensis]MCV7247657.1 hypothetical protein [Mycolicibacillus koreensis]OSC30614.1 hypothetical protein B8W67_16900 [Mycolicibacillus koreensis]BBY54040.1 hypothetical protein MKOR_12910 [Mycolicibacillus koreensis]
MAEHRIEFHETSDGLAQRWESGDGVKLRGVFRHNPNHPFRAVVFADEDAFRGWHGGRTPDGAVGGLRPMPVAISAHPGQPSESIDVAAGDVLVTELGRFEIKDDWQLNDPYLVRAS